jgi:exopolyphosphatase/guanosine-5'-triphosphate,3'-diphosphate pyrophosphatase
MRANAAIDLGSNSCRLLIAEAADDGLRVVHERVEVVGLGRGVDEHGRLRPEVAESVIALLADFARDCRHHHAEAIAAVGTSALRDATDRDVFVARVRQAAGFDLEVIGGAEEARLSFLAAARAQGPCGDRPFVAIDFGGGSTEFIFGRGQTFDHIVSLDIGSRRLLERYLRSDPPTEDEWTAMMAYLGGVLRDVRMADYRTPLIGIGGTVVHLSRLIHGGDGLRAFDATQLASVTERVRRTPMDGRRAFIGLDPRRADVIVAGCGLVAAVLGRFRRPIQPIAWGLRHGLFLDRFGR